MSWKDLFVNPSEEELARRKRGERPTTLSVTTPSPTTLASAGAFSGLSSSAAPGPVRSAPLLHGGDADTSQPTSLPQESSEPDPEMVKRITVIMEAKGGESFRKLAAFLTTLDAIDNEVPFAAAVRATLNLFRGEPHKMTVQAVTTVARQALNLTQEAAQSLLQQLESESGKEMASRREKRAQAEQTVTRLEAALKQAQAELAEAKNAEAKLGAQVSGVRESITCSGSSIKQRLEKLLAELAT